jgi:hypothetical protein
MTPSTNVVESPEVGLGRDVLFAVELWDPVALTRVWRGLTVEAAGLSGVPLLSRSGRFVWLRDGDAWPGALTVTPHGVPFAVQRVPAPAQPAQPALAGTLVRITLRPTPAYALPVGVTALRGQLRRTAGDPEPIPNVRVQLCWRDADTQQWVPPPPDPYAGTGEASPREVQTDAHGEFAVFLRPPPVPPAAPTFRGGLLAVRLQFTGFPETSATLVTPDDFPFLDDPDPAHRGCVPEGLPLGRSVAVGRDQLEPTRA